ncbi:accessory Sec system translocase SecA2 [Actinomadura rupiterrae]|uniref:accessory Sec system translocase SecA2 n=1 Tax=Actinomadura rupiterrae TaxID=559627 RepID=UPI0020A35070|nr:accessory Sec system translocase SecA2 [Actinomadura rupiterrae]MCP2338850.1 preprotein translocase subunit SecA [Actinomadura rupiterrae]
MALRDRLRRLVQKPGSADLAPLRDLVADAAGREERVRALSDAELTAAAEAMRLPRPASAAAETGGKPSGKGSDKASGKGSGGASGGGAGKSGGASGGGTGKKGAADIDLAELCALGREAARRTLGERPYDVQLTGVLALLRGQVAEMATGEGKTLSGAIAAAGYALRGRRVHVMSVNDYLARRDAEWMGPLYGLLGVTVAWVGQTSTPEERRAAYAADVTYAPVSEIGFDLLRDRLATSAGDRVLPAPEVALIDEADSVLVDEAMVPLVLAGAADSAGADPSYADLVRRLRPGRDYGTDTEARNVQLTAAGAREVERSLGGIDLYAQDNLAVLTAVNVALHAEVLLQRDVDYIVRDGAVKLVSESRGRVALLQRWPDGLQAAVEAKEALDASPSGEILDSVTVQELIGRYPVRCGMTGTALAVAGQLREFYDLDIAVVPPNRPCVRDDRPDRLYATSADKEVAVVEEIAAAHEAGRPVLVGTGDVAESERLARRLTRAGFAPIVLNAKNDAEEAAIIAGAGAPGAITVSTQIAGRGTDIRLGGPTPEPDGAAPGTAPLDEPSAASHQAVVDAGGLLVIGTGRYHSSRLDDQLRGRAGRQGDPGASVFFTSLQDDLVTRYAPDEEYKGPARDDGLVEAKSAHWIVGHAQRVAEGVDLELHRNTWHYNHLIGLQRAELLAERERVLSGDAADRLMAADAAAKRTELIELTSADEVARAARQLLLFHLDRRWSDHLAFLTDVREGIHLRSLGRGLDPLIEFNSEAVPAGKRLLPDARAAAVKAFENLKVADDGTLDLAGAGLQRPSATWTYLVHDNPFGSMDERVLKGLISMFKGKK